MCYKLFVFCWIIASEYNNGSIISAYYALLHLQFAWDLQRMYCNLAHSLYCFVEPSRIITLNRVVLVCTVN